MPIAIGDIAHFESATAGHMEYHICVKEIVGSDAAVVLVSEFNVWMEGRFSFAAGRNPVHPIVLNGRVPQRGVGAVGNWLGVATAESLA